MGGEPTFVSIDDGTSAQWTTDADGPEKRERSAVLAQRMKAVYAPQRLLHHGQGKWYPGGPLPRWQIALHWRLDGRPLWRDPALRADPWWQGGESAAAKSARNANSPTTAVTPATAK